MGRAPCCDKASVKKGPWSPEEDAELKAYIEEHGTAGNWIALPQKIGLKRCGKSCRLRWLNYLRPNIKHGGFSEEEDDIICSLYLSIGSRWSIIASQLPGRTDNDIKNYWNTRLKKKMAGKHRKEEQQARRGSSSSVNQEMKREYCGTNFMISAEAMNQILYWPELPEAVTAATNSRQEDHLMELLVSSLEGGGRCLDDHQQPNMCIHGKHNQHPFEIFPTQEQLYYNSFDAFPSSTSMDSRNSPCISQLPNLFPGFNEYPIEVGETPLQLDGLETFSGVEMVNGSSGTGTSSAESISWDNVNPLVYPPMASINYEAWPPKSCMFEESSSGY